MAGNSRPLATLPWIKFRNNPNLTLEESAVFKNAAFINAQERQNYLAVFRGFNKWFPFYISPACHNMIATDIIAASPNGKYWADAINFLISMKGPNSFAWKIFQEHLECDNHCTNSGDFTCPDLKISELFMASYAQEGSPMECQKAEDFLLDPLVLIQLPAQPPLFHQWLVAFIAEISKIRIEMSELYYLPYGDQFKKEVNDLMKLLEKADEFSAQGLNFLQACADSTRRSTNNVVNFPELNWPVKILKDHFRHDLLKVIGSYKKYIWANLEVLPWNAESCGARNKGFASKNIYNLNFWRHSALKPKIFCDLAHFSDLHEEEETEENVSIEDLLESLQAHCSNQLELDDQLKEFLKKDETIMKSLLDLRKNETISSLLRIREEEHGIIGTIMSIFVYENMIDAVNRAKLRLCEVTGIHPRILLRTHYDDLPDEQIAKDFIAKNLLQCNEKENVITKYGKVTNKKINRRFDEHLGQQTPDYREKPNDIARIFEARIVKIVLKKINAHRAAREVGNITSYSDPAISDWQIAQFILPCFVATIQETFSVTQGSPISSGGKKWFVAFVDAIIRIYESCPGYVFIRKYEEGNQVLYIRNKFSSPLFFRASMQSTIFDFLGILYNESLLVHFLKRYIQIPSEIAEALSDVAPIYHKISQENCTFDTLIYQFFYVVQTALRRVANEVSFGIVIFNTDGYRTQFRDLITVICYVGLYPNFKLHKEAGLSATSNLVLSLVKLCLDQADNKDELKSTHRLDRRLRDRTKGFFELAKEEVGYLDEIHQLGLAVYLTLKLVPTKALSSLKGKNSSQSPVEINFNVYVNEGVSWHFLALRSISIGSSWRVNRAVAQERAPVLYYVAMNELNNSNTNFKITSRVSSWIFPIEHCRYCGKLDETLDHRCNLCFSPESVFAEKHYFCSDDCKEKAMKKFHQNEHYKQEKNLFNK